MEIDFLTLDYLRTGTEKQKKTFDILQQNHIFNLLADYHPILVGTIPLNIDISGSDIDIICGVADFTAFSHFLCLLFSHLTGFRIDNYKIDTIPVVLCNFYIDEMEIEIFASTGDPKIFNGYRHLLIEHRILTLAGEDFKNRIIELKQDGLKTEPAFASLLQLSGDPYQALLALENQSDNLLKQMIRNTQFGIQAL